MMRLTAILSICLVMMVEAAGACSCIRFGSAAEQVLSTDVVFEGVALETIEIEGEAAGYGSLMTIFEVTASFKGSAAGTVNVFHSDPSICCICGVGFAEGDSYLIFAHERQNGDLGTSSCSSAQFPREAYDEVFDELLEAEK